MAYYHVYSHAGQDYGIWSADTRTEALVLALQPGDSRITYDLEHDAMAVAPGAPAEAIGTPDDYDVVELDWVASTADQVAVAEGGRAGTLVTGSGAGPHDHTYAADGEVFGSEDGVYVVLDSQWCRASQEVWDAAQEGGSVDPEDLVPDEGADDDLTYTLRTQTA